jgi:hypothetical protein
LGKNWYKFARDYNITTLEDRNRINAQIRSLQDLSIMLSRLAKGGYQDMPEARKLVLTIIEHKKLSSFPKIKERLEEAYNVGLDNYNKFRDLCNSAIDSFYKEVKNMEEARRVFVEEFLPAKMQKGKSDIE